MKQRHRVLINIVADSTVDMPQLLAEIVERSGGTIDFCRFNNFADKAMVILVLSGEWAMPAHTEKLIESLRVQHPAPAVEFLFRSLASDPELVMQQLALSVQVVAVYANDILPNMLRFFITEGVRVIDTYVEKFVSSHSNVVMITLGMTVAVTDANIHLSGLRERFLEYCDILNADGMIELEKS